MQSTSVRKILSLIIICVLFVIAYQLLLTTSIFNGIDSTLANAKSAQVGKGQKGVAVVKVHLESEREQPVAKNFDADNSVNDINVIITFTNAKNNVNLQEKFRTTVGSMFRWTSSPLKLYIIGDKDSQMIGDSILKDFANLHRTEYKVIKLDTEELAKILHEIIKEMQQYFSYKPGAYYSESLFFLSIAIHRVMPQDLHKVIMLDADLKFNNDIKALFKFFDEFSPSNVIGIARENQPVYRHILSAYRQKNPGTHVGDPPPHGITGFNSGVLLLNLDKMRKSDIYNSLISSTALRNLTEKYVFKGHLGDQDLFSLLSIDHGELFYMLPCTWNKQLCSWWKDKGYESVFDLYFKCEGHINIYHGNCNSKIPKLDWEK